MVESFYEGASPRPLPQLCELNDFLSPNPRKAEALFFGGNTTKTITTCTVDGWGTALKIGVLRGFYILAVGMLAQPTSTFFSYFPHRMLAGPTLKYEQTRVTRHLKKTSNMKERGKNRDTKTRTLEETAYLKRNIPGK